MMSKQTPEERQAEKDARLEEVRQLKMQADAEALDRANRKVAEQLGWDVPKKDRFKD